MSLERQLLDAAKACAKSLAATDHKLVFAESCTSGLLAATMSRIPGISQHFCGSFVTYRESLKEDALGVKPETLATHTAVSAQASREMLDGALERCREATIGLAITGHLGPGAPTDTDGVIFIACGVANQLPLQLKHTLASTERYDRQLQAAIYALQQLDSLQLDFDVPK